MIFHPVLIPVESYVRISSEVIYEIGEIIFPNILLIFHPSVITLGKSYTMPFYTGLKQDGIIMINTKTPIPFYRGVSFLSSVLRNETPR